MLGIGITLLGSLLQGLQGFGGEGQAKGCWPFEGSPGGSCLGFTHRVEGKISFLEGFWIGDFSSLLAVGRPPHNLQVSVSLGNEQHDRWLH